jgi:hypothetical protein
MQKTGPPNRVPKEVQHHFHPHGISTPSSPPGIHKMQNAEHPPATSRKHDTTIIPTRNKRMRIAGLSKLLPHGSKTPLSSPPGISPPSSPQRIWIRNAEHPDATSRKHNTIIIPTGNTWMHKPDNPTYPASPQKHHRTFDKGNTRSTNMASPKQTHELKETESPPTLQKEM